ncbi:putative conserved serine-threonine rich protein [Neofusicoccum parvum UCRNP2]|uniref:Putative conserved serine-threonine rich protein n=1 Tax=Botryosphaeria parva (strain UCR-NP2) TaxID=1287680 RepID=R1FX52_BOTPV|nr:putative conserved serine-threonine rich protein [Neofusicoccum parvum UCRNP2]
MLAHSINRGVSKNALARPNFPSVVSRGVANWGRRRWPRWRDNVADEEFKQLQLKMDAFHKQIEANPYETLFGRSNEMLRGILRTPLEPESPRKTVPISTDSAETKPRDGKAGHQQGAIELTFDPISGRMIPKYGSSTSSALEESSIHYSQTHVDPRDDALKAFDKKQTSTPTQSRDWLVQEGFTASSTPTKKPAASGMNEQEQLQDSLAKTEPVQYDDGYSREPMGLETSFEKEQASGRSLADEIQAKTDPKNHIVDDGYSREPMGLETSFERERASGRSLADEIKAKTDPKEHIFDDGYSRKPTGLETSYQRELESGRSLEEEIQSRDNAHLTPLDDGYSREPTGLQSSYARELAATSYEREIEACKKGQRKSLEEELQDQSLGLETSFQREVDAHTNGKRKSLEEELAVPVDGGAVETMSTKEEAAKLKAAREQRLHDIALIREVRDIYEKYYGKITTTHRQAKDTSTVAEAATTVDAENEGRVDEDVHQSLSAYEEKNNGAYNFKPDNLEAELVAQNLSASSQRNESASKPSTEQKPVLPTASEAGSDNTIAGLPKAEEPSSFTASTKPRVYKLLAFDRTTQSVTTSQTSSTVYSSSEHPIPLSVALSNLAQPAKFISQLQSLQREGFEPVASTANLLVLRLRDDKAMKENTRRGPRPNPVDGTTIPLPPTPTMSPTGYINLDPVMENPAAMRRSSPRHKDDRKVRKTEPVFSGERSRKDGSKGQSVKTVLTTLIWATAACYVAGVAGEVAKGY